jgi:hypothetical protein
LADPISQMLALRPTILELRLQYHVGSVAEIPAETLRKESRELHKLLYGSRPAKKS